MEKNVIVITDRKIAEALNNGLDDDNKVAFENLKTEQMFTYEDTDMSRFTDGGFSLELVSLSVLDGTLPLTKRRKMFT